MFIPFDPSKIPVLRKVPVEDIKVMMFTGVVSMRSYPKGSVIHNKEEPVEALEIIVLGEVSEYQNQDIPIQVMRLYDSLIPLELLMKQTMYKHNLVASKDTLILILPKRILGNFHT